MLPIRIEAMSIIIWAPCVYLNYTSTMQSFFSQSGVANDTKYSAVDQLESDISNETRGSNTKTKTRGLTVVLVQHLLGPPTSVNHSIRVDRTDGQRALTTWIDNMIS